MQLITFDGLDPCVVTPVPLHTSCEAPHTRNPVTCQHESEGGSVGGESNRQMCGG